jgi:RNA polymerase sigma-54 factor
MGGSQQKLGLNLKVAQKQILTPGLVQMVSVLALNKLELREMINAEMVANPVLEELPESVPSLEDSDRKTEGMKLAEDGANRTAGSEDGHDSFQEIDFGSFFQNFLDPGYRAPGVEVIDKPPFENFLSQPVSLADHLDWQIRMSLCNDAVRGAGESIIGNLNEDGYLTAT